MSRSTVVFAFVLTAGMMLRADAVLAQSCAGDCDGGGTITVDELVAGSRILFGTLPVSECPAADVNGDASVDAAEMQAALIAYERGCVAARNVAFGLAGGSANAVVTLSTLPASPGIITVVTSSLAANGNEVVAYQQDISFSPQTPLLACTVGPLSNKEASAFAPQPPGCTIGVDCTSMRALILSFVNLDPIPDGPVFGCSIDVSISAPAGVYPLLSSNTLASDSLGNALPLDGIDGAVIVSVPPTPTPTAAPAPASLILERVRLRADNSQRPDRHNGSILAVATVNANAPFGDLTEDIVANGVRFDVSGAGGVAESATWGAGDCETRTTARGPRLRCVAEDGDGFRKLDLRPLHTPNLFKLKLKARGRDFLPPLTTEPLEAVLHTVSFDRVDYIGGCRVSRAGLISKCRETGVVPTETPTPTATSTFTPTPSPTPTPTLPGASSLIVSDALGVAGGTASFSVLLETPDDITATENEIHLSGATFGSCQVNPAINKNLISALLPSGCAAGVDCTGLKTIVISFSNLSPIASGQILYTCQVFIDPGAAPGDYPIDCTQPGASSPAGMALPIDCVDGTLTVVSP